MKKNTHFPIIFHTSWFDSAFGDFAMGDRKKYDELHELFTLPRYRVSDTDETYRSINYWDEQGLLLGKRKNTDSWRQFNILDVIWMKILQNLKRYGMQADEILTLKEMIFEVKNKEGYFVEFEFWVYMALANKDVLLIVLPDGQGSLATPQDIELHQMGFGLGESFITINFKQIVRSILKTDDKKNLRQSDILLKLNQDEITLLHTLTFKKADSVTAHLKDGKINRIEWKTLEQKPELLMEMIRKKIKESQNQTITIKQQDGKVLFVEQKTSQKIT